MRVKARITFLTAAEGGRTEPIRGGRFRPNHLIKQTDRLDFDIGQVVFSSDADIGPGESGDAIVDFIPRPGLKADLAVARSWRIHEGAQLIAIARIIEPV